MNQPALSRTIAAACSGLLAQMFKAQFFLLLLLATLITSQAEATEDLSLQPSPTLTPQEVVTFQLSALGQGSEAGISATYRFASPENRQLTGPLTRFARLFDFPKYQPMLKHRGAEIKLISNDGFTAKLLAGVVDQSGELHWYRFRLSRQTQSPYENCWMTDAVLSVPHPGDSA